VTLYEATPQAGGRCKTIAAGDGFAHDNGTHALLTANTRALAFLEEIGARAGWIEPEPAGIPVLDLRSGRLARVGLSPWSWIDPAKRPAGLRLTDLLRLARLALPLRDRPVAAAFPQSSLLESFVEPLTVAVLNTPVASASTRRLGYVVRRVAWPGSARLLVARHGLTEDLVAPALRRLRALSAEVVTNARLRGLVRAGNRVTGLAFADGIVGLEEGDRVVLALPPWEARRLLPSLAVPRQTQAILNAHYRIPGPCTPKLVGLRGARTQWVLARSDHTSITISASKSVIGLPDPRVADGLWPEVRAALQAIGIATSKAAPPARVVAEKRATIRHAVGDSLGFPPTGLVNLDLAGDWGGPLPATIEASVTAGEAAARSACRQRSSAALDRPARAEEAISWSR
jgi:hypothetical protein